MALQCVHDAQGECKVDLLPASGPPFPQNIEAHKGNRPNYPKLHFRLRPTAGVQFVNGGIVFESGSPITCDQKGPFQVLCDNNGTAPGGPFKYSILLSNRTIDPFVLNK